MIAVTKYILVKNKVFQYQKNSNLEKRTKFPRREVVCSLKR